MGAIDDISEIGQAMWLDDISTIMLDDGSLASLSERCNISGVTANPTIFEKRIADGAYADLMADADGDDPEAAFRDLAVTDVQRAPTCSVTTTSEVTARPAWSRWNSHRSSPTTPAPRSSRGSARERSLRSAD